MPVFNRLILSSLVFLFLIAGCGSSGDDDDEISLAASRFSGTYTSDIDTGSFSFTVPPARDGSAVGSRTALSGVINSANFGSIPVPGTWSAEFNDLRLDSPAGAIPFVQIFGSFDGSILHGFTAGDLGNGVAVAVPDEGGIATTFCGRFTRNSGPVGGSFNLVVTGSFAQALVFDEEDFSTGSFSGSVTGTTLNLNDGDGTSASGTIVGSMVSGTWVSDDPDSGNWSGSTADCVAR